MNSPLVSSLDNLTAWRRSLDRQFAALARFLGEHELNDTADAAGLAMLQQRLRTDQLLVAFVAEFSRGKSELINAIFFADSGRRVLPATPGRTTMCPVELAYDADEPVQLSLLPIETRLQGLALAELRGRADTWARIPLQVNDAALLAQALTEVTRTRKVSVDVARALGLWSDERQQDNPVRDADGQVDVPAWRHAVINYPHPLLKRGLVVLDTPGLNAIGAEPELTLGLLPSAHATVFMLAADTGVTRSDLAIWREHLSGNSLERFVVLNKIDTLADPLSTPEQVAAQIELQRQVTARALSVPVTRVYPLSAREGLSARICGDAAALQRSRLPELEEALSAQLLPRQREMLSHAAMAVLSGMRSHAAARLAEQRRHNAEQMHELASLRGKSGAKVRLLLQRLGLESSDFERCTARLTALRAVHLRMLQAALGEFAAEKLRGQVQTLATALTESLFNLGARKALARLCDDLHKALARARAQMQEAQAMLAASYQQLNAEFGFAFSQVPPPGLERCDQEIALIERNYSHYLGPTQAWRLSAPRFMEQFQRMLLSKLRMAFESAAGEIELWGKTAATQIDHQLRDRRQAFARRREALERIQAAAGELEMRIQDVQAQDQRLADLSDRLDLHADQCGALALGRPEVDSARLAQPQTAQTAETGKLLHLKLDAA